MKQYFPKLHTREEHGKRKWLYVVCCGFVWFWVSSSRFRLFQHPSFRDETMHPPSPPHAMLHNRGIHGKRKCLFVVFRRFFLVLSILITFSFVSSSFLPRWNNASPFPSALQLQPPKIWNSKVFRYTPRSFLGFPWNPWLWKISKDFLILLNGSEGFGLFFLIRMKILALESFVWFSLLRFRIQTISLEILGPPYFS